MNKGMSLIEAILVISFWIILILFLCASPFVKFSSRGVGHHSGVITAIDQVGYIFPNYEVYFKTDFNTSQEDKYCVNRNNKEISDKLKEANSGRKKVTITYKGVRGIGVGLCSGEEIYQVDFDQQ